jgi:hypothetical protein
MNGFRVIHPLDDVAEQKCSTEGLGKIRITRAVRVSLGILRAYLILMTLMLGYHVLDLSGLQHRIR